MDNPKPKSEHCESCGSPLTLEEFRGSSDRYCRHCTDATGNLLDQASVRQQIAGWLLSWQSGITPEQANIRAAHFLRAMPAWADD